MMTVATAVAGQVRDRLRHEAVDPASNLDRATELARLGVRAHNDVAAARGLPVVEDEQACVRAVLAEVCGYGPLQPYLDDPEIEELWVNAPDPIFIARMGVPELLPLVLTEEVVRDIVERMLNATGRRVDLSQPFVDASLPDGSRLHVVIPDITRRHWSMNVRKFLPRYRSLDGLARAGSMPPQIAAYLHDAMVAGASVLVSGATHAGNTTWEV